MSLGRVFLRDTGLAQNNRKEFILIGKLWLPAETKLLGEYTYVVVGHEMEIVVSSGKDTTVLLQLMSSSAVDVSKETKKRDPNRILPLITIPPK